MGIARILVSIDLCEGLVEELELMREGKFLVQQLDYEGISFRCLCFHGYGHLLEDCNLPFIQKPQITLEGAPLVKKGVSWLMRLRIIIPWGLSSKRTRLLYWCL